ncbi:hypothetical protein QTN47_07895 [Danxiaibacter flavus]|uniref:Uncharacterized protein n=1 Tax=Danxiaibacter flavus TaxID=3049108 RepID=A0ABV3ZEB6_9BACT|nr:hypothetical protein QNM32_07895 [Chitinophagaceae bacterium DXS]
MQSGEQITDFVDALPVKTDNHFIERDQLVVGAHSHKPVRQPNNGDQHGYLVRAKFVSRV